MTEEKRIVSCALCSVKVEEDNALKIRERFLCLNCEEKIVSSTAKDSVYPIYVEKIKEFWLNTQ